VVPGEKWLSDAEGWSLSMLNVFIVMAKQGSSQRITTIDGMHKTVL
jgi:hypothetical protein